MPHRDPLAAMATGLGTTHDMPASVRAALVALGSQQHLMRGCALFRQGDPADALYVVESGLLEVSILSPSGRKLTLNMLRKGTVFGEIAIFDGGLRSATVTAATPCVLLRIDRQALLEELRDNARFALDIIRLCVARVRWVSGQLEDHVFQPLTVRLARRLLYLLRTQGEDDGGATVVALSQSALAEHVGVTREAVAKALSEWKAAGLVAPGRGRITILDVKALHREAQHGAL